MTLRFHVFNMNCREERTCESSHIEHKLRRRERVVSARSHTHLAATGNRRASYFREMSHALWELVSINCESHFMSNKTGE